MTNSNIVEIKLKRRTVEINLEEVKSLVGRNDVTINEICKVFDKTTYEKKVLHGKKIDSDTKISFIKTMEQFISLYNSYKNPTNKRQVLYSIVKLHNEDATPIDREENTGGAPISELSVYLEALVIFSLENNLLPKQDLTIAQWMSHFGLVNRKQHEDYNKFLYKKNYKNAIKEARRITNDVVEFLEDDGTVGFRQLKDEHIKITLKQIMYSYDTISKRLKTTLLKLDKRELIEYNDDFIYGVKYVDKKDLSEEEIYYLEEKRAILETLSEEEIYQINKDDYENSKVLLTTAQVLSLDKLKLDVKKEIGEMKQNGEKTHASISFKLLKDKLRNEGLVDEKGDVQYFDFIFNTATINRVFTDRELKRYLDKNEKIKEVYEQGLKEVIHKYNELRLEHLINWFDNNYNKQIKKLDNVDVSKFLGKVRKEKEFEMAKRKIAQDGFNKFGKDLSRELMIRNYSTLLY